MCGCNSKIGKPNMKLNFKQTSNTLINGAVGTGVVIGADKVIGMIDTEGKLDSTLRAAVPIALPILISLVAPKMLKNKMISGGLDAASNISVFRVANSFLPDEYKIAGPFDGNIAGAGWSGAKSYDYTEANPQNMQHTV